MIIVVVIAAGGMVALGVLFALGLALASHAFVVQEDARAVSILEVLPGANCGACGYGGCRAYAQAVVEGEKVTLCTVGGQEVANAIGSIMGVEVGATGKKRAVVHCKGGVSHSAMVCEYDGELDCRAADLTSGGPKACLYGCLGYGSCARACPFDAIAMNAEKLPVIDPDRCTACGICVRTCPRDLISLLDMRYKIYLGCSNRDSGKAVKNVCSVGCITCGLCAKKDPNEAIAIENGLPVLDWEKSEGDFRVAAELCPMDSFVVEAGEATLAAEAEGAAESSAG